MGVGNPYSSTSPWRGNPACVRAHACSNSQSTRAQFAERRIMRYSYIAYDETSGCEEFEIRIEYTGEDLYELNE